MEQDVIDALKALKDEIQKSRETSCHHCGFCPHCGRSNQRQPAVFPYPLYPVYPTYRQPYWGEVTCGATGAAGNSPTFNVTATS